MFMVKKIVFVFFILAIVISGLTIHYGIESINNSLKAYFPFQTQKKEQDETDIKFKTARHVPQMADFGSFLAGFIAKNDNNLDLTAKYFKKVLVSDPENQHLRKELYVIDGVMGNIADMIILSKEKNQTDKQEHPLSMSGYILIVDAMKQGEFEQALSLLEQKKEKEFDPVLNPLLEAWNYAALKQEKNAIKALDKITREGVQATRIYHRALIAEYFGHKEQALENYNYFQTGNFSSLNVWISIKDFFEQRGFWTAVNPLFNRYYNALAKDPILFDVLRQTKPRTIQQPLQGVADAFYLTSLYFGKLKMLDVALLFNNMALYLDEDALLPKIWGAHLYEQIGQYVLANEMYDKIKCDSNVISLKKSTNYIAMDENEKALEILKDLKWGNQKDPFAHILLAESYQTTKEYEKALKHYTKALALLKDKNKKGDIASVYYARGNIYGQLGQLKNMEMDMLASLEFNPNDAEVLNYIGYEWLVQNENLEQAVIFIERANKLTPNKPHILDSLALAYYKQERYNEALPLAEQAVDKMGASSVANMHLGDVYMALGRKREAYSQYKKALELKMDLTPELKEELLLRLK